MTDEKTDASAAYAAARSRSEEKNQAVRDSLEPLEPGERPLAVTIAMFAAIVLSVANLVAYAFSSHDPGPDRAQEIFQILLISAVLGVAAWGMYRAKYWAVLGFQTLLALQLIILGLSLTRANSLLAVAIFLVLIALASVMFWFLIRAMARLQMPEPPEVKALREKREKAEEENG